MGGGAPPSAAYSVITSSGSILDRAGQKKEPPPMSSRSKLSSRFGASLPVLIALLAFAGCGDDAKDRGVPDSGLRALTHAVNTHGNP